MRDFVVETQFDPINKTFEPNVGRPTGQPQPQRQYQTQWRPVSRFRTGTAAAGVDEVYERRQPWRPPTVVADVTVPMLRAVIFTVPALVLWLCVFAYLEFPLWYALPVTALTFIMSWMTESRASSESQTVAERVEYRAPDVAVEPDEPTEATRVAYAVVELKHVSPDGNATRWQSLQIPADIFEQLPRIALAVQNGANFSRPVIAGKLKIISQDQFNTLAAIMTENELLDQNGTRRKLTDLGQQFLQSFLPKTQD